MMYAPKIGQKVRLRAPKSLDDGHTFIVDAVHGKIVEMHKDGFPLGLWLGAMFVWGLASFVYYSIYHLRRSLNIARAMNKGPR